MACFSFTSLLLGECTRGNAGSRRHRAHARIPDAKRSRSAQQGGGWHHTALPGGAGCSCCPGQAAQLLTRVMERAVASTVSARGTPRVGDSSLP